MGVELQFHKLTFSTSHSSIIEMSTTEVNSVQATIPAVDESVLPSCAEEVVKVDGPSSLAKEGIEISTSTCASK